MPATPKIWVYHGAGGTTSDISAGDLRYKRKDNSTADLSDPVPIPSSGVNYSAVKFTKIAFITAPSGSISNLRWFLDATPATGDPSSEWVGVTLWAGHTAGYTQSVDAPTGLIGGVTANCDSITVLNPLTINGSTVITSPSTGVGTQNYLMTQMAIAAACLSGLKAQRPWWYRWTEF